MTTEKRNAWHKGAEQSDLEYVDANGDVAAMVWPTTRRWAWEAYLNEGERVVGVADRQRDAKAAAVAALRADDMRTIQRRA